MIAKTAWKPTKANDGIVKTRDFSLIRPLRPKNSVGLPRRPPPTSFPKASE